MKVYFSGSHSSGKSTLARYVSEKYKLPLINEVARMILSEQELQIETLRSDLDTVNNYQRQVYERQLTEEQKYQGSFVSDRSLLDTLAYAAQHTTLLSNLIQDDRLNQYVDKLNQTDTYIFFVRPSKVTLKDDGVRENPNWNGVVAIDAMIKFILQMYDVKYYTINTDNMQERVKLIDSILVSAITG